MISDAEASWYIQAIEDRLDQILERYKSLQGQHNVLDATIRMLMTSKERINKMRMDTVK